MFSVSVITSIENHSLHLPDYRGHWCIFCDAYLKSLHSIEQGIADANGATLAVTAEPEHFLPITRKNTGYAGKALIDAEHKLLSELKCRGVIDIAISEKKGYANGMAQPAVIVLKRDGTVLERWACVPGVVSAVKMLTTR